MIRGPSCRRPTRWHTKSKLKRTFRSWPTWSSACASYVNFDGRRILYTWIGGTRRDWRGQGHFRALTEQQEAWAIENGFDEILVKTKNRFYEMRGTLDHLHFNVVKYEPHADNEDSKVYLEQEAGPGGARRASQHEESGDCRGIVRESRSRSPGVEESGSRRVQPVHETAIPLEFPASPRRCGETQNLNGEAQKTLRHV